MTNQGKTDIIKTTASFLFKKKAENKKTNFQKRVSFKNGCFTEKQFKHHRKKNLLQSTVWWPKDW